MMTSLMEAIAELDETIQLLEAGIPGSLDAPGNKRLVKSLQGDLADYFEQVELALPMGNIEALYYKRVKQEA